MFQNMIIPTGASGGEGGDLKQLRIGTPSSATIDLGEPFEYLFVSMAYSGGSLCNCEWDSSNPSSWVRYYGANDAPTTYQLPQTTLAGLKSVSASSGTFDLMYYEYMKNVEVFYK